MKLDWPPVIGNAPVVPVPHDARRAARDLDHGVVDRPRRRMIVDVLVPLLAGHHGDVGLLTNPRRS
jgi:hypothetical protein